MAEMIRVNKKVIHDPMYTPVRQWLTERIAKLEIDGDPAELALAKERYESLVAGDLVIEDVKDFTDGIQRVCIVSRKTGFARVDIEFKSVPMQDILDDFGIQFTAITDIDALKEFSKTNTAPAVLLWLEYKQTYGVLLTQEAAKTIEGVEAAFGNLFFNQYTTERETLDYIDWDTIESGTVTIKDPSIGSAKYPLFIQELVLTEANLPIITSNLPEFITTSRGQSFSIPNTYWFGGILDITQSATVEITTKSGYTIPERSADNLFIDGETIYGSSLYPVTDQIIVRVTHMYNGRPIRRTFRIEVRIDIDVAYDLEIEVRPETIKAARQDEVMVIAYATFKGTPTTLLSPPAKFKSPKGYGDLTYTGTNDDGGMVYEGTITGIPPMGLETDNDLYVAEFEHTDGVTAYKAPGYINFELIRAEDKPVFAIKGLTTTLRGYINDVKQMEVKAFYGETPVPAYELGIKPGPRGDEHSLVRFDSTTIDAVNYTVIRDSQLAGQDIEDEFEQKFTYLDPNGIKHTLFRTIKIVISKLSSVQIIPVNVPREVTRYQKGGPLFRVMVNGLDKTSEAIGMQMAFDAEYDKYIKWEGGMWTIKHSDEEVREIPVKFSWSQPYDGKNNPLEFDGLFRIKVWDPGTNPGGGGGEEPGGGGGGEGEGGGGESGGGGGGDGGGDGNKDDGDVNTEVVVFPMYYGIDGLSDERGQVWFRVYADGEEITKTAVRDNTRTVMPPELRDEGVRYDDKTGMLVWTYYKLAEVTGAQAKIFYMDPKDVGKPNLPSNRLGRMYITANVKQSRILKLVEQDTSEVLWLDGTCTAKLRLSFAGEPISLQELIVSNILPSNPRTKQARMIAMNPDSIEFTYTDLQGPGSTHTAPMQYEFSYTDPLTSEVTKLKVTLNITIKIQNLEITQADGGVVNAKMWDSGAIIFKAMIGSRDVTGLMSYYNAGSPLSKYVSLYSKSWSIADAPKEDYSELLHIPMRYTINSDYRDMIAYVPKTFNIEGWDGITFRATVAPLDIVGNSGDVGEIRGKFQYKWDDCTNGIRLDRSGSAIPNNIELQNPIWDPSTEEAVIRYTLQRGGKYPMTLRFLHPTINDGGTVVGSTDVTWAAGLNRESVQDRIDGYHGDVKDFDFRWNFSGKPITNLQFDSIVFTDTPTGSLSLASTEPGKLRVSLDQQGTEGTPYDCSFNVVVTYTDPESGIPYSESLDVPVIVTIPKVKLGNNPLMSVKVYDRGQFKITLVDDRGQNVPITGIYPDGTNNYVSFVSPNGYYVTRGDTEQSIVTEMAVDVTYDMAGNSGTIPVVVQFQINKFDSIDFVGKAITKSLEGKAGEQGVAEFEFLYKGDVTHSVNLSGQSVIPPNLIVGALENSLLPYTLKGQGTDTAKFRFIRKGVTGAPVEGKDFVDIEVPVKSVSSDEPFTLVEAGSEVEVDWMKTGVLPIKVKYGDYELAGNAPGLSYKLSEEGYDGGIVLAGGSADGVTVKGDTATVPGTRKSYLNEVIVTYDVGGLTPKQVKVQFNTRIFTPTPVIVNNDKQILAIWDKSTFPQSVNLSSTPDDDVVAPTTRVKILPQTVPNTYVEMTSAFGFEVVGAPPVTSDVIVPLEITYTLKGLAEPQTLRFNTTLNIVGHVKPRFYCEYSPTVSEGVLDEVRQVRFRPVWKDEYAPAAVFKQNLSTLPEQVYIQSVEQDPNNTEWTIVTLYGSERGVGECKFVWWSPEVSGGVPEPDEVWEGKVEVRIMGEPGIEFRRRDNELIGKHLDTGTYLLEVLFGGIPVVINEAVDAGIMTMKIEPWAQALGNGGVTTITGFGADTFEYAMSGPIWPAHVANTEEVVTVTYRYGGQTYTGTAKIPLEYTSGAITLDDDITQKPDKMFTSYTLMVMNFMCDGVNLDVSYRENGTVVQAGVKSKYVEYSGKSYSVEWADQIASTQLVSSTFAANYRGRAWSVTTDVPFELPAWDQRMYTATLKDSVQVINLYVGESIEVQATQRWRAEPNTLPLDYINEVESDFGGLMELEYTSKNSSYYRIYKATGIIPGTVKGSIWFDRLMDTTKYPYKDPKELYRDYDVLPVTINVTTRPLTISNATPLAAGNDDTLGSGGITVRLNTKNITIDDPNLQIIALDPDVLTIEYRAIAAMNYRCTLPLGTKLGDKFTAKFKYVYTDPGTNLVHEGIQEVEVTYRNPADYPLFTAYVPGGTTLTLWRKIAPFITVKASGVDITSQCKEFDIYPEDAPPSVTEVLKPWAPGNPYWLQCVRGTGTTGTVKQYYTIKAPFRGDWVEPLENQLGVTWTVPSIPEDAAQLIGTFKPNPIFLGKDQTGKLEFNFTYRGEKTILPVLNNTLSDLKGAIRVDSVDRDSATNVITANYTVLEEYAGDLVFCWELPGETEYVLNKNRVNLTVTSYPAIKATPVEPPPGWGIWLIYGAPFTLTSGTMDLLKGAKATAVNDPYIKIHQATTANGPTYKVINSTKEDTVRKIKFTLTLNTAPFVGQAVEVEADVLFKAWDGKQYEAYLPAGLPLADDGKPILSVGRGLIKPFTMTCKTWNEAYPGGTSASDGSGVDQGLINTQGIVRWNSGGSNSTSFNFSIYGIKNGYVAGKLAFDYKPSGVSLPNGYPPGTEGKNRHTFDVYYEVFEPELTFVGEMEPDEVIIDAKTANNKGFVTRGMKFGRDPISYRDATISIREVDRKVVYSGPFSDFTASTFSLLNAYVNRWEDQHVEIQVSVAAKVGTVTYTKTYMQRVLLKGSGETAPTFIAENLVDVNAKIYDVGSLPFTIKQNGGEGSSWSIWSVEIQDNEYVRLRSPASSQWEVYNASKTGPVSTNPVMIVTMWDGVKQVALDPVTTTFNIEQWDGKQLSAKLRTGDHAKNEFVDGICFLTTDPGHRGWNVTFQGKPIVSTLYEVTRESNPVYIGTGQYSNNLGDGVLTMYLTANGVSRNMIVPETVKFLINKIGRGPKVAGTVEGVDYIYVDVDVLIYERDRLYPIDYPTAITGKRGVTYTETLTVRKGITRVDMNNTFRISYTSSPMFVLGTSWADGIRAQEIDIKFGLDIDVEKRVTNVATQVSIEGAGTSVSPTWNIEATQLTTVEKPIIDGILTPDVTVSQKGKVPFRVMHGDVDVTNDITNIVVDGGKYIKQTEFNTGPALVWEVVKSEVAGVAVPTKFTFDVVIEGVTFSMETSATFNIAPFIDYILSVSTATPSVNVGVGKPGALRFVGSWGQQSLATSVELDLDNSELGTLITVAGVIPNADGSLTVNYVGGVAKEEGDVKFRFKAKNGNSTPVEGYDWKDVTVAFNVMLTSLEKVLPFEITGEGTIYQETVLSQKVTYDGIALDNNDPNLRIVMTAGAKVGIKEITENTIVYRYLEKQPTEVTHRTSVNFEYKGVAKLVVPLTLVQKVAAADPVVSQVEHLTVENDKFYTVPFTILSGIDGRDLTSTLIINKILFNNEAKYFNVDELGSDTFSVTYFDKTQLEGAIKYDVTVTDGSGEVNIIVDGTVTILPNLKTAGLVVEWVTPADGQAVAEFRTNYTAKAIIRRNDEIVPAADIEVNPTGTGMNGVANFVSFARNADGQTIEITLNIAATQTPGTPHQVPVNFTYIPEKGQTQIPGTTYIIQTLWTLPVAPNTTNFVWVQENKESMIEMSVSDTWDIYPKVYYGTRRVNVNQCTWKWYDGYNSNMTIAAVDAERLRFTGAVVTNNVTNATFTVTYNGSSDNDNFNGIRIVMPNRTYAPPKQESTPAPNKTADFMFSVPTPVIEDWVGKQGITTPGPRWITLGGKLTAGELRIYDSKNQDTPVKTVLLNTLTADAVGRYAVPIDMTHIPMTVKIISGVVQGMNPAVPSLVRTTAPVNNTAWDIPGAPVLSTIDDNIINTSVDVTTKITFRMSQSRKSGLYRFDELFTYTSVEGPATYVASGIENAGTKTQFIQVKGTGEKGDITIHGTVTDIAGYTYPVTLKLKAEDPSQVEFVLIENEITAYEEETGMLTASATYQGAELPLNHAEVTITAEPAEWIQVIPEGITADEIKVKVTKDVDVDETFTADIILSAYGEQHKQRLTVNLLTAVPELVISDPTSITGGNGDVGNSSFVVKLLDTVIPLNDPKLTITPASDFEVTEKKAGSFVYKITTPLGELGKKVVKVAVEYEVGEGVVAKGSFDQQMTITNPSDYPHITSIPDYTLNAYLYGMTPPTVTIMSGTEDISSKAKVVSIDNNDWIILPPLEDRIGTEWFWVANGPVSGSTANKTFNYKLSVPFRDTLIEMPVQQRFLWGSFPIRKDTWVVDYAPNPIVVGNGEAGEVELDVSWAGRKTTDFTVNYPVWMSWSPAFVRDGKVILSWKHTAGTTIPVGLIDFTLRHNNVGLITTSGFTEHTAPLYFKRKSVLAFTITSTKGIAGGMGNRVVATYTNTNNGNALPLTTAGVTVRTEPEGILKVGTLTATTMDLYFDKKVDAEVVESVKIIVEYDGASAFDTMTVTTKPAFYVEPIDPAYLEFQNSTEIRPITVVAWNGTQRVPNDSGDLLFSHGFMNVEGTIDDYVMCSSKFTEVTAGTDNFKVTHVPTGSFNVTSFRVSQTGVGKYPVVALSTNQAVANERKELKFQIQVGAEVINLNYVDALKLTNVPPEGNAVLSSSDFTYAAENNFKDIVTTVNTGWTGTGVRLKGFVQGKAPSTYQQWYAVDTTFNNVAQAEIKGITEKTEYNPDTAGVTIKFKLEQKQGLATVGITDATFGEIIVGGEIGAVGPITASGDVNYPYEVTITPTGTIGAGTLKGVIRTNGIDQEYTVFVSLNTPRLKVTTTATEQFAVRTGRPVSIPLTVTYGETLINCDDPDLIWTVNASSITDGLRRLFAGKTNVVFQAYKHGKGVAGTNRIVVTMISDPTKFASVEVSMLYGEPETSFIMNIVPNGIPNANFKGQMSTYFQYKDGSRDYGGAGYSIEVQPSKEIAKPILSIDGAPVYTGSEMSPSANQRTWGIPMTTGWTGGKAILSGYKQNGSDLTAVEPFEITIPQSPLIPVTTDEVGDEPVLVNFTMTQVRGINGGPIVDLSTIPGITFKTVTFDSAIVQSVSTPVQGEDGNFSMTVTRKAGDKTNTLVPISMVITVEGVDYLTIVNVKFTVPTPLVAVDGSQVTGSGNKDNPVTLTQSVYLPN